MPQLRRADLSDLPAIRQLFLASIDGLCQADYNDAERASWRQAAYRDARWHEVMATQDVQVVEVAGQLAGFGSLAAGTYLDFLYVHPDFARQGIATLLLAYFRAEAQRQGHSILSSDVSKTARPFFEEQGFVVLHANYHQRGAVTLINYRVQCELLGGSSIR